MLVIGAVLTLGAAGLTYTQLPSRYQATARMLLLLPANARGDDVVGSPFLYLPNGLTVLARIVAITPTSRDFQAMMFQQGLVSQYEVGVDNASPTITVTVEGSDPQNVVDTRDRVIEAMNSELLIIQREENAPVHQIAHTRVYAAEPTPEQIGGSRFRGVLAVGGAGALLTLILAFVIDRLAQIRTDRRGRRLAGESSSGRRLKRGHSGRVPTEGDTEPSSAEESEPVVPGPEDADDSGESAPLPHDFLTGGGSDGASDDAPEEFKGESAASPDAKASSPDEPGSSSSALTRLGGAVDAPNS